MYLAWEDISFEVPLPKSERKLRKIQEQQLNQTADVEAPMIKQKGGDETLLTYTGNKKKILTNVTGYAKPGELVAIMGASGGGKTSLLNILASRVYVSKDSKVSGNVKANGKILTKKDFGKIGAFVQ